MTTATQQNAKPTTPAGAITLDDVRAALRDTDPRTTNAGVVQRRLGRGSTTTVQRFLELLRAELTPPLAAESPVPSAPPELVSSIWAMAWTAAQAQTTGRLAAVVHERDAARERIDTLSADLEAATGELDKTSAEFAEMAAKHAVDNTELQANVATELAAAMARATNHANELAAARAETEHVASDARHAAELAQRDADLKDAAHARIVEHLTGRVAELKSALHRPPPTAAKAAGMGTD